MIQALVPRSDFLGLEGVTHLAAGGEAPWLAAHTEALSLLARDQSGGMPGRANKDATVERARELAARLLGVDAADVALLSSTTEGVNVLALALDWRPGDTVVVEAIEFPSLVFPWTKLKEQGVEVRIVRPGDGSQWNYTLDDLAAAVDSRTRLLATSQVSYLTGRRHDLAQLREIADRAGALLLVDATHGAGVIPVEAGLADIVVSSCYKWLLGTQGIALFYRDPQRLGALESPIVGWHSRAGPSEPHRPSHHPCGGGGPLDELSLERPDVWTAPTHAGRFEAANVSYLSAYLLERALAYLSRFPAAQLEAHSVRLTGLVLAGFARLGLEITTPQQPERRAGNATCVVPAGINSGALAARLAEEGVLVWGGDGRLRVSCHLYNDEADVERLLAVLPAALAAA